MLIEVELLLDWYIPRSGAQVPERTRASFVALWREALQPVLAQPQTWVLRDFHSPNLLWLPERDDTARVGLLDFQDAQIGPQAYDLASLLQDARVDVPEAMELALLGHYCRSRRDLEGDFDTANFIRGYSTLAAQRGIEDSRNFRAAGATRRQAAISATHAAGMESPAALAHPSLARCAANVVSVERAGFARRMIKNPTFRRIAWRKTAQ